jgi:1-acyl-sn-glycerol-3-phosphate acyltransferase
VWTLVRALARVLYRIEVRGAVPASGPFVLAANHEAGLDAVILPLATRRPVHFMAKQELWRRRPIAWLMDALGGIPVSRGRGDVEALRRACSLLEAGEPVGVFPQGTTVRGDRPWRRGAAKLALATGAPLVPVLLVNTREAFSRGRIGFPKVRILIGEPIAVERAKPAVAAARELIERLREAVEALG